MKKMNNELGAIALPFLAPTSGTFQGTAVSPAAPTGIRGLGGTGLRLRARDLSSAPDSVPGGPVI
ncbi:hypothetical protein [Cellulomonas pakistanensis]|uniref:Uncharacterized protein n=1 Tax=Cellulomonas pakistanensis TaxID=992287 RepID=A0A919U2J3_9CELL|nr:hypothetical protein [Cellulomonas pakistanensis]GIG35231.1 hypothetical protein Cpa01nite_06120 [Cellulomonas pakistanensis]